MHRFSIQFENLINKTHLTYRYIDKKIRILTPANSPDIDGCTRSFHDLAAKHGQSYGLDNELVSRLWLKSPNRMVSPVGRHLGCYRVVLCTLYGEKTKWQMLRRNGHLKLRIYDPPPPPPSDLKIPYIFCFRHETDIHAF